MTSMARKKTTSGQGSKNSPDAYTLRFPPGMRQEIERDAEENFRVLNAHILWLIRDYLRKKNERDESGEGGL